MRSRHSGDVVSIALALARLEAMLLIGASSLHDDEATAVADDVRACALGHDLCRALEANDPSLLLLGLGAGVGDETVLPSHAPGPVPDRHARLWRQQLLAALTAACAEPDRYRRLRLRARALLRTLRLLETLNLQPYVSADVVQDVREVYNHLDMVCRGQRSTTTVPTLLGRAAPLLTTLHAA